MTKFPKVFKKKNSSLGMSSYYVHIVGNSVSVFGSDTVATFSTPHDLPAWDSELESDITKALVKLLQKEDATVTCDIRKIEHSGYVNRKWSNWTTHQRGLVITYKEGGCTFRTRIYQYDGYNWYHCAWMMNQALNL